MRQLADLVGISNPYLSQIERGLRSPSEEVLEAIAENLATSAETLRRRRARQSENERRAGNEVVVAIGGDQDLTPSQREALVELYLACIAGPRGRARSA